MTQPINDEEDKAIERIDFLRKVDAGIASLRAQTERMMANLTPQERAIIERRFNAKPQE